MIIRLNTKHGTKRINIHEDCTLTNSRDIIGNFLNMDKNSFQLFIDLNRQKELQWSDLMTIGQFLKNGDFLYICDVTTTIPQNNLYNNSQITNQIDMNNDTSIMDSNLKNQSDDSGKINSIKTLPPKEDEIDIYLHQQLGLIHRSFDPQLCRHMSNSKCIYCAPLESFDEQYLSTLSPPVKHLPFHCYLRQLKSKSCGKDNYVNLEIPNCKVKTDCITHPPWPFASCNKCIPSAITLGHQPFRFVDNIMFQSHEMVDYFINYWRKTGAQRMGFLYGYFDQLDSIPLAIRSNIVAIYEPPQINSSESIELLDDVNEEKINEVAKRLGLQRIGWIFTQLIPSKKPNCIVEWCRKKETFFVSAQECITAASFQNQFKNVCKFAPDNYFGSKFVTVIISGNSDHQIDYSSWQMSVQAMALVESDCIVPTIDNPGLAYLRNSTNEHVVPDVFYNDFDQYNNTVTKIARPVPIDYFLVQVSTGFPIEEHPMLYFNEFPHLNRQYCSEIPRMRDLNNIIKINDYELLWKNLKNFNVLLFMITQPESIYTNVVYSLCDCFRNKDFDAFVDFLNSEQWNHMAATILFNDTSLSKSSIQTFNDNNGTNNDSIVIDDDGFDENPDWACTVCTYINSTIEKDNDGNVICVMCAFPRNL